MKNLNTAGNRFIQKKNGIFGPVDPRPIKIDKRKPEDYPDLPQAYLDVAKMWGPRFGGPPLCDMYVELLKHMFTEEEAEVFRHLKGALGGKTALEMAETADRSVEDVVRIMDVLTDEKRITLDIGSRKERRYFLQPLIPGAWETIVLTTSMSLLTDWQKKFVELFLPLYETGYTAFRVGERPPGIRYLPVGQSIEMNQMALPADKMGEIFQEYDDFAVGLCQCRIGAELVGNNCGRPMENCVAMGPLANREVSVGKMRRVNLKEVLEIKAEAEASGLVSWTMNLEINGSNTSCSCCGCCCMMMRAISEFNSPGYIAPPHFMPEVDAKKCTHCGKCAKACPMGAWTVNARDKTRSLEKVRCIGCGLCYVACDKEKAVELKPVPGYETPKVKKIQFGSHPLASISGVE
ncbi:MAG: 4Fe-4S dicluster domain-containing protein [Proteobacteria bacterium]|nr:4Fe-4S dicluster domain-containing protein [Pseudomonadota bacterium]